MERVSAGPGGAGPRFAVIVKKLLSIPKRLLVGRPLRSSRLGETLLPKKLALPVFCSDPLSSNAYATEEILLMLSLGGLAFLHVTPWVALAVVLLLTIVVLSYRQTWCPSCISRRCRRWPLLGATHPSSLVALTVRTSAAERNALVRQWTSVGIPVPLAVVDSFYRDLTDPVLEYISMRVPETSSPSSFPNMSSGAGGSGCSTTRALCASR
jgi:hypothetical protein